MTRRWTLAVLFASAALGACRDRGDRTDLRTLSADEMARQGKLTLADSQVVTALESPKEVGRIIYDAPEDLSLANAQRTRHDLFPSDTARTNPASGVSGTARRDSTGGDATADTSGGAAKPRPRRP
jgi:hypothetical protein